MSSRLLKIAAASGVFMASSAAPGCSGARMKPADGSHGSHGALLRETRGS